MSLTHKPVAKSFLYMIIFMYISTKQYLNVHRQEITEKLQTKAFPHQQSYDLDIEVTLTVDQGHLNMYNNVKRKRVHHHAKLERSCFYSC